MTQFVNVTINWKNKKIYIFLHLSYKPAKFKVDGGRTLGINDQTQFSNPNHRLDCWEIFSINVLAD